MVDSTADSITDSTGGRSSLSAADLTATTMTIITTISTLATTTAATSCGSACGRPTAGVCVRCRSAA